MHFRTSNIRLSHGVGGALLNEALSDDEPQVVVNNYYEGDDDSFF
ncbi:hypothetical protein [Kitasatospora sp. NPDC093558]